MHIRLNSVLIHNKMIAGDNNLYFRMDFEWKNGKDFKYFHYKKTFEEIGRSTLFKNAQDIHLLKHYKILYKYI